MSKEIAWDGVIVTIERLPNPDFLNCDSFCTSMDGTRYAFVNYQFGPVRNLFFPEGRFHVIVDGEILREHSFFYRTPVLAGSAVDVHPCFSPDNAHVTYCYDGHAYLNGDEVTLPGYDQVLEVLFLPDSSPIYIATRDNVTHVISGKNRLVASDDYIEDIAVSADGTILYCVSRDVRDTNGDTLTLCLFNKDHTTYIESFRMPDSVKPILASLQDDHYLLFENRATRLGYLAWRDGDSPARVLGQHPGYAIVNLHENGDVMDGARAHDSTTTNPLLAFKQEWNDNDNVCLRLGDSVFFELYPYKDGQTTCLEADVYPQDSESPLSAFHRSFLGWRGKRLYRVAVTLDCERGVDIEPVGTE